MPPHTKTFCVISATRLLISKGILTTMLRANANSRTRFSCIVLANVYTPYICTVSRIIAWINSNYCLFKVEMMIWVKFLFLIHQNISFLRSAYAYYLIRFSNVRFNAVKQFKRLINYKLCD